MSCSTRLEIMWEPLFYFVAYDTRQMRKLDDTIRKPGFDDRLGHSEHRTPIRVLCHHSATLLFQRPAPLQTVSSHAGKDRVVNRDHAGAIIFLLHRKRCSPNAGA